MLSGENKKIIEIPEEYLPSIKELPGELPRVAKVVEESWPGMGVKVAVALALAYPGQDIYFHSVQKIKNSIRDDRIRAKYDQGAKVKDLATETGLSTRQIERILAEAGKQVDDRQLRMW